MPLYFLYLWALKNLSMVLMAIGILLQTLRSRIAVLKTVWYSKSMPRPCTALPPEPSSSRKESPSFTLYSAWIRLSHEAVNWSVCPWQHGLWNHGEKPRLTPAATEIFVPWGQSIFLLSLKVKWFNLTGVLMHTLLTKSHFLVSHELSDYSCL